MATHLFTYHQKMLCAALFARAVLATRCCVIPDGDHSVEPELPLYAKRLNNLSCKKYPLFMLISSVYFLRKGLGMAYQNGLNRIKRFGLVSRLWALC